MTGIGFAPFRSRTAARQPSAGMSRAARTVQRKKSRRCPPHHRRSLPSTGGPPLAGFARGDQTPIAQAAPLRSCSPRFPPLEVFRRRPPAHPAMLSRGRHPKTFTQTGSRIAAFLVDHLASATCREVATERLQFPLEPRGMLRARGGKCAIKVQPPAGATTRLRVAFCPVPAFH